MVTLRKLLQDTSVILYCVALFPDRCPAQIIVRQTPVFANSTISQSTASPSPRITASPSPRITASPSLTDEALPSWNTSGRLFTACTLSVDGVGFNSWWSTHLEITVATVVTQYLQYNNTVIAGNKTTLFNTNASSIYNTHYANIGPSWITALPTDLLEGLTQAYYAETIIAPGTAATVDSKRTIIQSPVPWTNGGNALTARVSVSYDGGSFTNFIRDFTTTLWVENTQWIQTATQLPVTYSGIIDASIPAAYISFFHGQPEVVAANTWITECFQGSMNGQPSVHIPVNELTASVSSTTTINAILSGPGASKTPASAQFESIVSTAPLVPGAGSSAIVHETATVLVPATLSATTLVPLTPAAHETQILNPASSPAALEDTHSTVQSPPESKSPAPSVSANQPSSSLGNAGGAVTSPSSANVGGVIASLFANPSTSATGSLLATAPVVVIGSSAVTVNSESQFKVGSQTLVPGGSAITVGSTTYSLAASGTAIVVNGATSALPAQSPSLSAPVAPVITIASSVITANSASAFKIGDQILAPGGSAIQVSGTTYSLAPSGTAVVVNGQTSPVRPSTAPTAVPVVTVGGSTVTQDSSSQYVFAGHTLSPGGSAIQVSGTTYSLALSGAAIVVNGQTSTISPGVTAAPSYVPVITVGGSTVSRGSLSQYVVAGQTLTPGGSAVQVSGTTYSLAPSGTAIIVNGVTAAIASPIGRPVTFGSIAATPVASSAYVVAGQTLSPEGSSVFVSGTTYSLAPSGTVVVNGQSSAIQTGSTGSTLITLGNVAASRVAVSDYIVAGQTLAPGGSAITVSGTAYSLALGGSVVYVNGKSSALPTAVPGSPITLGNVVATPTEASGYVIAGQTLAPGSAITVSGSVYSLAPSGTALVVDGKTSPLPAALLVTLGGSVYTVLPTVSSGLVLGTQTLHPGSQITIAGETLSLAPGGSGIVVVSGGVTTTDGLAAAILSGLAGMATGTGTAAVTGTKVSGASGTSVAASTVPGIASGAASKVNIAISALAFGSMLGFILCL
ncbi:hypothetical protein LTR50_005374 [Elasticomyces elasticus]|nr:hypothetical protein LTR50_005374 [Elasticomyces elasticus]